MNIPRSKITLIIGAAAIIIVVFLIVSGISNNQPTSESFKETTKATITPVPSPTLDPGDPNLPTSLPAADKDQATTSVQGFLQAYGTQSWTDASASAWIERTRPFVTKRYFDELNIVFAGDGAWARFVREKTQTTVVVLATEIIQTNEIDQGKITAKSVYQVGTSRDQMASLPETFTRMITLRKNSGQWSVDAMTDFSAGAPAPSQPPVTPPAVPPTIKD